MAPKPKFADGEKVLCFHGPLVYEAKCLKFMVNKEKEFKYFIHYAGWNKNWDEWVEESRVLKYNETNLAKQKEIEETHSNKTSVSKRKKSKKIKLNCETSETQTSENSDSGKHKIHSSTSSNSSDSGSDGTKTQCYFEPIIEKEDIYGTGIKIELPDEFKSWLVDDWDIISRQKKLPNLPAVVSVDEIMNNYVIHSKVAKGSNSVLEFSNGIKDYFSLILGSQLLYKFERPQYAQILHEHPNIPVSKIYGPIHLLRLCVKLESMVSLLSLDETNLQLLLTSIKDFFKYLIENVCLNLSLQDYTSALPEYLRQALV